MKKKIIIGILMTIIFVKNSVFAMDKNEGENLRKAELGTLHVLPKEIILSVLTNFDATELVPLSTVSKKMYDLTQDNHIWKQLASNLPIYYDQEQNAKSQFKDFHLLFSDSQTIYSVPLKTLQFFMQIPIAETNPPRFSVKLGNKNLELTHTSGIEYNGGLRNLPAVPDFSPLHEMAIKFATTSTDTNFFNSSFVLLTTGNRYGGAIDLHDTPMGNPAFFQKLTEISSTFTQNGQTITCDFKIKVKS